MAKRGKGPPLRTSVGAAWLPRTAAEWSPTLAAGPASMASRESKGMPPGPVPLPLDQDTAIQPRVAIKGAAEAETPAGEAAEATEATAATEGTEGTGVATAVTRPPGAAPGESPGKGDGNGRGRKKEESLRRRRGKYLVK